MVLRRFPSPKDETQSLISRIDLGPLETPGTDVLRSLTGRTSQKFLFEPQRKSAPFSRSFQSRGLH